MSTVDPTPQDPRKWALALADRDGMRRQTAREQLVAMGRSATPALTYLLADSDPTVRWEAAMALKDIADSASAQALALALADDDRDVRWVAAEGLAAIGRPSLKSLLTTLVSRSDAFEFREGAEVAVSLFTSPTEATLLAPVLQALRSGKPPEVVSVTAAEALEELGAGGPPDG